MTREAQRILRAVHSLRNNPRNHVNLERLALNRRMFTQGEALEALQGQVATWFEREATGRIPDRTFLVRRKSNRDMIDWTSPSRKTANIPFPAGLFDTLLNAVYQIAAERRVYISDNVVNADPLYEQPVSLITTRMYPVIFAENMFRTPSDISGSYMTEPYTVISLPDVKLDDPDYRQLFDDVQKHVDSDKLIALDLENKIAVLVGFDYGGGIKKSIFTAMNYELPLRGVLSMHCSAVARSIDPKTGLGRNVTLMEGLSGTGKSTLGAGLGFLIGDDEHGVTNDGTFTVEGGCYMKTDNVSNELAVLIALLTERGDVNRTILENVFTYPNGCVDFADHRLTTNGRASIPIDYLPKIVPSGRGEAPHAVVFLTADHDSVLPAVSVLNKQEALYHFLSGFTTKTPGTEVGVTRPTNTFSQFHSGPFTPLKPSFYLDLFDKYFVDTPIVLLNTGGTGGPYGVGQRIPLADTRRMLEAATNGELNRTNLRQDPSGLLVPEGIDGLSDQGLLDQRGTWKNKERYVEMLHERANAFEENFRRYEGLVSTRIKEGGLKLTV